MWRRPGHGISRGRESETLGGLVFAQLNVIPEDGSHPEVELYGLHIRVEELTDRRVESGHRHQAGPL